MATSLIVCLTFGDGRKSDLYTASCLRIPRVEYKAPLIENKNDLCMHLTELRSLISDHWSETRALLSFRRSHGGTSSVCDTSHPIATFLAREKQVQFDTSSRIDSASLGLDYRTVWYVTCHNFAYNCKDVNCSHAQCK